MRRLLQSLIFLNQLARTDDLIHEPDFARSTAGHAVGSGEPGHHLPGILYLAAVEDPFPGHKDIVETTIEVSRWPNSGLPNS